MTEDVDELVERMRSTFDASFERAAAEAGAARELLIAIRAGGARYALRPGELSGLVRARAIVPLPGAVPARVGLASVQGALVPVYALASFLGLPPEPVRWLAVRSTGSPVALGFAELDGSMEVEASALEADTAAGPHIACVLDDESGRRLVVDVASIVSDIASACRASSRED